MANLTSNAPRRWRGERRTTSLPVAAAGHLYAGAAVEEDGSGTLQNGTAAGTTFLGIALEEGDNTDGAAGDVFIEVAYRGTFLLTVAHTGTFARTDLGATVYLSDGNTFTIDSVGNQAIGKIAQVPEDAIGAGSAKVWVEVEGVIGRSI